MGQVYGALSEKWSDAVETISSSRRKRKRAPDTEDMEETHSTPKKMRMESTMRFIYKALFLEGRESDISVRVLDKVWKLHKMYLQQSPYFESMFSGAWAESSKSIIDIEVTDPRVTVDSINVVFSSCYTDELTVDSSTVVNVLAAAALFQMDGVIDQCVDIMKENICTATVVKFYNAALDYGIQVIKDESLRWLAINLVSSYEECKLLLEIYPSLMEKIVRHKDLCIIQSETFLYIVLRMWAFLHLHPHEAEHSQNLTRACEKFYRMNREDRGDGDGIEIKASENMNEGPMSPEELNRQEKTFLEREEGQVFVKSFEALRVEHLVEHIEDATVAQKDNLLPRSWLQEASSRRWMSLLALISNKDNGPVDVTEEVFDENCLRLGLELDSAVDHSWKWNCFTSGVELVWTVSKRSLSVERVRGPVDPKRSNSPARRIALKIAVTNLNEKKQVVRREVSPIMEVSLTKNQPLKLFQLGQHFTYPMFIQVFLLLATPTKDIKPEPLDP